MISFLYGHDADVAKWAFEKFQIDPRPITNAVGILHKDELAGAFLFQEYNGSNAELSFYGKINHRVVREVARAALILLKVNRLTVRTRRYNKHILRSIQKFGFSYEGVQKMFYGPSKRDDAILFGMLKPDLIRIARMP